MIPRTFVLRTAAIRTAAQRFVGEIGVGEPPIEVIVREHRAKRSLSENAKLWTLYRRIGDHLGYTADEMHDVFRRMFLPVKWVEILGEGMLTGYPCLTSTAKLNVKEAAEYLDRIEQWCAENGVPTEGEAA